MLFLHHSKFFEFLLVSIVALDILSKRSIKANSFCPPLKASMMTNLTCELPKDRQKIDCSSSWLPNGTIAYFECFRKNGDIRKGRIKCNEDCKSLKEGRETTISKTGTLPCDLYEDESSPQIHVYGYKKARHYLMPNATDSKGFREIGLFLHNSLRHQHKSDSLELDENLNQKAQKWAEHLLNLGRLDMAFEPSLGQNIFSSELSNQSLVVNDAIQHWYHAGSANFNWTNITANWDDPLALDFTQIIWKSTRKLGLGAASRVSGNHSESRPETRNTIIVAFYFPMGNIVLEDGERPEQLFLENVSPSSS